MPSGAPNAHRTRRRSSFAAAPGALGLVALLLSGPRVAAQSNDEVMSGTQFDFSTPGARSLALGGAFIGVADDATAAHTNPAGLVQMVRPEVTVEARRWRFTSRFAARGHAPDTGVTGIGIDTVDRLEFGEIERETAGLSFLSYLHTGRRWAAAIYRHQLADFGAALRTQGPFTGRRDNTFRIAPAISRLDLAIETLGVTGAVRVGERWSLGAGVVRSEFALTSRTDRFARREATGDIGRDGLTGGYFGPADFLPENLANTQLQSGDDRDWTWSAGALFRPTARWSVGAMARRGGRFRFAATFIEGPAGQRPGEIDPELSGPGVFAVPDVWGLGLAYRPTDPWLVALDWTRVEWSDMSDDLLNVLRAAQGERRLFRADDANQLHLGVEYQWLRARWPVALRGGAWLDPEHRIRYTGEAANLRVRFRPGDDQIHLAFGVGLVVGRAQFDLAADLADAVETLSLSMVARF